MPVRPLGLGCARSCHHYPLPKALRRYGDSSTMLRQREHTAAVRTRTDADEEPLTEAPLDLAARKAWLEDKVVHPTRCQIEALTRREASPEVSCSAPTDVPRGPSCLTLFWGVPRTTRKQNCELGRTLDVETSGFARPGADAHRRRPTEHDAKGLSPLLASRWTLAVHTAYPMP